VSPKKGIRGNRRACPYYKTLHMKWKEEIKIKLLALLLALPEVLETSSLCPPGIANDFTGK